MTNRKDAEARAREVALGLIRGEAVGGGDGGTFIPRAPTVDQLASALLSFASEVQREAIERAAIDLGEDQWKRIVNAAPGSFVRVPVATFAKCAADWRWILGIVPQTETVAQYAEAVQAMFAPPTDICDIATAIHTLSDPDHADVDGSRGYFADDITYDGARLGDPVEGEGQ